MFMRTKNFSLILLLASLCLGQSARAYYDPTAGRFISFDSVAPPVGSMDGYSFANGDPVNQFDSDGRLGKGFYAGLTDSSVPANASSAFMAGYTGGGVTESYYGTLFNEGEAVVSPSTYINGAESFGNNINTVYQSDGVIAAGSYAATSWNVGAVWSGAANINLATGEPVGNGVDQAEDILSGIAGTAGVASGGLGVFNAATAPAATVPTAIGEIPPVIQDAAPAQQYYIENGVRRSVASLQAGASDIPATIYIEGQSPVTTTVPLNQLFSPKPEIPMDTRFLNIQPPIQTPIQLQPLGLPGQLPTVPINQVNLIPPP